MVQSDIACPNGIACTTSKGNDRLLQLINSRTVYMTEYAGAMALISGWAATMAGLLSLYL
jgi:hypothetical protein